MSAFIWMKISISETSSSFHESPEKTFPGILMKMDRTKIGKQNLCSRSQTQIVNKETLASQVTFKL